MTGQVSKRVPARVSYSELSDSEEDSSSIVVREVIEEVLEKQNLNKKKQYKSSYIASVNRNDWEIDVKSNTPNGSDVKDSYYLKIICQPGIYRLVLQKINAFLLDEYRIRLKSEKPDKYGEAFIKNSSSYAIKIGGREKILK